MLFEINDGNKIKGIIFNPTKEEKEIKQNNFIELIGRVEKYENELEIVVEKVNKID